MINLYRKFCPICGEYIQYKSSFDQLATTYFTCNKPRHFQYEFQPSQTFEHFYVNDRLVTNKKENICFIHMHKTLIKLDHIFGKTEDHLAEFNAIVTLL